MTSKEEVPDWSASTTYWGGCIAKWPDGRFLVAKQETCGNPDDWYDPSKFDRHGRQLNEQ